MTTPLRNLWRKSSSLIILGRNRGATIDNGFDYKVLLLKRPTKLSFPGGTVFPGGIQEKSDESDEWLTHIKNSGIEDCHLKRLINSDQNDKALIKCEVTSRITAIRETFEELGILLCKSRDDVAAHSLFSRNWCNIDVGFWQKEVHNCSAKFLDLCELINAVPDLWGLHKWSAWLTPTFFKSRFETMFYLAALDNQADLYVEKTEIESAQWQTPLDLLNQYNAENIWLPPPQLYELSRLCKQPKLDDIAQFAANRINRRCATTLIFPIKFQLSDGYVTCYPGDDFYPNNPDTQRTAHNVDEFKMLSCEEFRDKAKHLHRCEHYSLHKVQIFQNLTSFDDHLDAGTKYNLKL